MGYHLNSRRHFLKLMGMSSALVVLGNWGSKSLAQISNYAPIEAWLARHGLTSSEYQNVFNQYTARGFRPIIVSGYSVGNQARYAALFIKTSNSPAWIARHGLSGSEYQSGFNQYVSQGYRPVQVSAYTVNNTAYYAAIFEKISNSPAWVARHGLTSAEYQSEFNRLVAQGYRPIDVCGYTVNNIDYYAAIFEATANPPSWVARHGMTSQVYQNEFNRLAAGGYRLVQVSGYSLNGEDRYAALWERSTGSVPWVAHHGMTSQQYQDQFERYYYQGYRPSWVNAYTVNGEDRYAAIWESPNGYNPAELQAIDQVVAKFMEDYDVPGLSFAIARNNRLVLAKTYGFADKSTGVRVAPRHRFRIASLSKPITAIAIMKLVETGQVNLSDRVFGRGAILGTQYGTQPYAANIRQITVEHLLTHTCGGWSNSSNDPMFSNPQMNHAQLIGWTLDNLPLNSPPGTQYAYSNFGYCVLGRIIEKVTGQSYESYVKNNILNACGVTDMEVGGDTLTDKKVNEVTYYGQNGENPYVMKVERMDSHGGWIAKPIDLVKVLMRVDGINIKPEILNATSLTTMYTASSANAGYAKGWQVNSLQNHWHNGSLPGEQAVMVNTSDGFSWAVLVNTRSPLPDFSLKLDQLMWNIRAKVTTWLSFEL